MDYMVSCTIGLGSNAADRDKQIQDAIKHLGEYLTECSASSIYETDAVNGKDAPYFNAVVHGLTSADISEMVKHLKEWECAHGRSPEVKIDGIVPIDLDLVIYDSYILRPTDYNRYYFNKGYAELIANGAIHDESLSIL